MKEIEEIAAKYPDFPRIIIRKIDTALRGVTFTESALQKARDEGALYDASTDFGLKTPKPLLGGALFRDGTLLLGLETMYLHFPGPVQRWSNPYTLNVVDGKVYLFDDGEPVEEIFFIPIPAYFGKKTRRGTPMLKVITARQPGCLFVYLNNYCHFWEEKIPCKYCSFVNQLLPKDRSFSRENLEDLEETINEVLKEEGEWTSICLTGGSDPLGNLPYENTVNEYVKVLKTLQKSFGKEKIYARIIASAFTEEGLLRLKEAGATTYEPHIEVWDEKLFEWVCPGKAKYFSRHYWIESVLLAVGIFGRGRVATQFVGGVELAQPYGFKTIEEALGSTLQGAEFFASRGVSPTFIVFWVIKGSVFHQEGQKPAPLEYYVRLTKGFREIQRKYNLSMDFNNYRCSSGRPDVDLARLDFNKKHDNIV